MANRTWKDGVGELSDAVKQLLFPRRCPVCDNVVRPGGEKICLKCLGTLKPIASPWCVVCGKGLSREEMLCEECRNGRMHAFRRARALYDYRTIAPSIYRFKYGNRREYGDFFAEELASCLGDFIREARPDGLVPIPLHPKRFRKRGYNQAEILARGIGKRLNLPVFDKILLRVKNTVPLKEQNSKERQNNLKKAFLVRKNDVKLNTIILIDDIYTTGSTVDEAALTLKNHGIENIYVLTLAGRGEG